MRPARSLSLLVRSGAAALALALSVGATAASAQEAAPVTPSPGTPPATGEPEPVPTTPAPAPLPPPYFGQGQSWDAGEPSRRVAVHGDSLVRQSTRLLTSLAASRSAALDVWAMSGGAPCDLLPTYGSRMRNAGTERVALAFVGNATSECMTRRIGGRPRGTLTPAERARIAQVYTADLGALLRWNRAAGVQTHLVLPPVMAPSTWHGQLTGVLSAAYRRLAAADPHNVVLSTAVHDALTPGGVYRPVVSLNGRATRLRHTDGTHLAAPLGTTAHASALLWPLLLEP